MYSYGETWGRLEQEDETWSRKEEGVKEHEEGQGTLRAIFSGQMGIYNHRIFAKHTHLRKKSKWKHGAKNGFHLRELLAKVAPLALSNFSGYYQLLSTN